MRTPSWSRLFPALALVLAGCAGTGAPPSASSVGFRPTTTVEPAPAGRSDSLRDLGNAVAELRPVTRIAHPAIDESSGLVRAFGSWWTHNDSGGEPVLFRSSSADFADAATLTVPGAVNVDWEELTTFGGDLLVCDIGDNARKRNDLTLYRVRPDGDALTTVVTYRIAYPDGPHDAEAAFEWDGALHIVVKNRGEATTDVFRFDDLSPDRVNTGRVVSSLTHPPKEQFTAGAIHAASGTVALLSYSEVSLWPAGALAGTPAARIRLHAQQCEALWWDGDDLWFTNEQRDVFRVDRARDAGFHSWLPPRPSLDLTVLPWTHEATKATQPRTELLRPIPLANSNDRRDFVRWALAGGDVLYLDLHFGVDGPVVRAEKAGQRIGTGALVAIARRDDLHLSGRHFQLAVDFRESGALRVRRIDASGGEPQTGSLSGVTWKGSVTGDKLNASIAIPLTSIFGDDVPQTFLFNVCGVGLGRTPEPIVAGHSIWSMLRPYVFAPVQIVR